MTRHRNRTIKRALAPAALALALLTAGPATAQTSSEVDLTLKSSNLSKAISSGKLKVLITPTVTSVRSLNLIIGVQKLKRNGWIDASDVDPGFQGSEAQTLTVVLNKSGKAALRRWLELGNPARIRLQAARDGAVVDRGFGKLR